MLLIVGLLAAGGIGFFLLRNRQSAQYEQEARAQAEMARAEAERARAMAIEQEAQAQAALVEAQRASAMENIESPTFFTIQLDEVGDALVEGQTIDNVALGKMLQDTIEDQGGDVQVVITAHNECPFQQISAIADICLKAGVRDVQITISDLRQD